MKWSSWHSLSFSSCFQNFTHNRWIWRSTFEITLGSTNWKLVAWSCYLNLQSSSPRDLIRKWEKSRLTLVNHDVRHHKMEDTAYGFAFGEEPRHSWSQAWENQEFHVEELTSLFGEWNSMLSFPSSLSGYQYKQEKGEEILRRLYFLLK
jgi:hypothetical protein